MANIIQAPYAAVLARLSDPVLGFNAKYAPLVGTYIQRDGSPIPLITFDFSNTSNNVVWGTVAPDLVISTSPFVYPLLTIDIVRAPQYAEGRRLVFHQFSGQVNVIIQVHLSWAQSEITDFTTWPAAVIDAMFDSVNTPSYPIQAKNVTQAGDLVPTLSPVTDDGENWRRTISFQTTLQVIS